MSNVVDFTGATKLDLNAERTLENLKSEGLKGFIIAGYTEDGNEFFSSTYADSTEVLWLIERFKKFLMELHDEE